MGFPFDGSKNGKGGQPAVMFINPNMKNPGRSTNKSSQKVPIIFGMNYKEEEIPPYCVLQTGAENPQIRSHFLKHTPHTSNESN